MKKALAILALVGFVGAAYAGPYGGGKYVVEKNPVVPAPPACYGAGYELGVFAAGIFPDSEYYEEEIGGGVSFGYFFNENLGLDLGATWFATDSEIQVYTLDLVYRMPMDCIAPYVFVGGGVHTNSVTTGLWRVGAGIDFRLTSGYSVFADGSYNWTGEEELDYAIARVGLRFAF